MAKQAETMWPVSARTRPLCITIRPKTKPPSRKPVRCVMAEFPLRRIQARSRKIAAAPISVAKRWTAPAVVMGNGVAQR